MVDQCSSSVPAQGLFNKHMKVYPPGMRAARPLRRGLSSSWHHLFISFCLLPLPYVNWDSQEGCLFHLKFSVQFMKFLFYHFHGLFPFFVFSVQSLSRVQLFVTPWTAARQASLSITNSQSLLKLMSIESVMTFNHFILCRPLLWHSIFPSIRVFSNESALLIRWPKYYFV